MIVYKLNPRSWAYLLYYAYFKLFYYLYYQLDRVSLSVCFNVDYSVLFFKSISVIPYALMHSDYLKDSYCS